MGMYLGCVQYHVLLLFTGVLGSRCKVMFPCGLIQYTQSPLFAFYSHMPRATVELLGVVKW